MYQLQPRSLWALFLKYTMIGTYLPLLVGNGSRMNVLEIFEAALTNNSKEGFLHLVLDFLLDGRWLLEGALSTQISSLKLYVYLYKKLCAL